MFTLRTSAAFVRHTCVLFVAALTLIAASSLAGVLAEAQAAATQAQCISQFSESDASDTCEIDSADPSGNNCTFGGVCEHGGSWHDTSITVDVDDADDLQNCSGSLATSC